MISRKAYTKTNELGWSESFLARFKYSYDILITSRKYLFSQYGT